MSYDEDDEWFYESITRYTTLLMFDFSSPIKFLDLNTYSKIYAIFKENECSNEIVYLALPKKLTVSRENEGLEKDSDFKVVCGGFSQNTVAHTQSLFDTNILLLSQENERGLYVFSTSEETGTVNYANRIKCDLIAPKLSYNKTDLLAMVNTLHQGLIFVDTNELIIKDNMKLQNEKERQNLLMPVFVSPYLLSLCDIDSGTADVYDTRTMKVSHSIKTDMADQNDQWTMSSSFLSSFNIADNSDDTKVGFLSTSCSLFLYDIRNTQSHLCCEKQNISQNDIEQSQLRLRFSPSNSYLISTSGFDSHVNIFDYSVGEIKCIFSHDGHERNISTNKSYITDHIWYKDSLISSCSNLSVHCWQHHM